MYIVCAMGIDLIWGWQQQETLQQNVSQVKEERASKYIHTASNHIPKKTIYLQYIGQTIHHTVSSSSASPHSHTKPHIQCSLRKGANQPLAPTSIHHISRCTHISLQHLTILYGFQDLWRNSTNYGLNKKYHRKQCIFVFTYYKQC